MDNVFTDDQIQDLLYDLLYDCGFNPVGRQIPNLQEYLKQFNLYLVYKEEH